MKPYFFFSSLWLAALGSATVPPPGPETGIVSGTVEAREVGFMEPRDVVENRFFFATLGAMAQGIFEGIIAGQLGSLIFGNAVDLSDAAIETIKAAISEEIKSSWESRDKQAAYNLMTEVADYTPHYTGPYDTGGIQADLHNIEDLISRMGATMNYLKDPGYSLFTGPVFFTLGMARLTMYTEVLRMKAMLDRHSSNEPDLSSKLEDMRSDAQDLVIGMKAFVSRVTNSLQAASRFQKISVIFSNLPGLWSRIELRWDWVYYYYNDDGTRWHLLERNVCWCDWHSWWSKGSCSVNNNNCDGNEYPLKNPNYFGHGPNHGPMMLEDALLRSEGVFLIHDHRKILNKLEATVSKPNYKPSWLQFPEELLTLAYLDAQGYRNNAEAQPLDESWEACEKPLGSLEDLIAATDGLVATAQVETWFQLKNALNNGSVVHNGIKCVLSRFYDGHA